MRTEANRRTRPLQRWRAAVIAAAALALVACGSESQVGEPDRVVARVNGYDITSGEVVHETFGILAAEATADGATARRALDRLVDQHLLAQEALEAGFDRDQQVREALEKSRRQILAEAYLNRSLAAPRPGAAEIQRFYSENPALFRERRIYAFRVFVLGRPDIPEELYGRLDAAARNGTPVAAVLKDTKIPFREAESVRSAEQLPFDLLPQIAAMPRGGIATLRDESAPTLMQLVDFVERPVTFEQASIDIERYLMNAAQKKLTGQKLADLRAAAHIRYARPREDWQDDGKAREKLETAAVRGALPLAEANREVIAIPDTKVRRP